MVRITNKKDKNKDYEWKLGLSKDLVLRWGLK
jgi:hypothetical protein